MCIFDKEFKKKNATSKQSTKNKGTKLYKPRNSTLNVGKNNKQNPIPSYWKLR